MKILLPDTITLNLDLPEGDEAVVVPAREPIAEQHRDAEVLVVWGSSRRHLASAAADCPRLRLIQSLAAGVDGILAAGFDESVQIATGAGLHSRTVSEHTLALLLNMVRRLPDSADAQRAHRWDEGIGGLQELHPPGRVTTLLGANVLILGFGEIGRALAGILDLMGANVRGVARSAGTRDGFTVIAQEEVGTVLGESDVVIDILPSTQQTHHLIDADFLAALPSHALVINAGRGTSVDQQALREALERGTIAGAAVDVTDPEPLPADDPLWDAPRLLVTPHAAGGRPVGAEERILHNVAALTGGGEMLHLA
jgi:phosphoglycerate dehydrogenase-like enzyme